MNARTMKILGLIVVLLGVTLVLLEELGPGDAGTEGELLFPQLKEKLNAVSTLTIVRNDGDITLRKADDKWGVENRDGYAADISKIREVLLAVAEARVVEEKTSDPELHDRLGLLAPDNAGSDSTLVTLSGDGLEAQTIFGHSAQANFRYARRADEPQAWLVDRNPDIPSVASDWLAVDLLDIDQSRIQRVHILHRDDETVHIGRESEDVTDYSVSDIPAGRELSYPTVANSIAGALNDLELEDARGSIDAEATATTRFETFDGLTLTATVMTDEAGTWVSFDATSSVEGSDEEANTLNEKLAGWQFRIAEYKSNLLTRRWEDILKTESE